MLTFTYFSPYEDNTYVFVRTLNLKNFRNYQALDVDFARNSNILCGANAQGKTNVVEAIYLASCARSHRTGKDKDLIKHEENCYDIRLAYTLDNGSEAELTISFTSEFLNYGPGSSKRARNLSFNGLPLERLADLFGLFHAVIFAPEDLSLIKDGPAGRRRFLDILISQISPTYFRQLQEYQKILKQRNFVLKHLRENQRFFEKSPQGDLQALNLQVWNEQLAAAAAFIITRRYDVIADLGRLAQEAMAGISDVRENLNLKYSTVSGLQASMSELEVKNEINRHLHQSSADDIQRGYTSSGPHRDDLIFFINDKSAKQYASQGQQRSLVLSLKIAELQIIEQRCQSKPVLILDDVMSELDKRRRKNLLEIMGDYQVFITCTDWDQIREETWQKRQDCACFLVDKATVKRVPCPESAKMLDITEL